MLFRSKWAVGKAVRAELVPGWFAPDHRSGSRFGAKADGEWNESFAGLFDVAGQATTCANKIDVFPRDLEAGTIELGGGKGYWNWTKETAASG